MRFATRQHTLEFGRDDRILAEPVHAAADRLAAISRLLPAEDRRLIDLILVHGHSHRTAATELRLAPGVVTRRVGRLRKLFASPTIRAIAEHLDSLEPATRRDMQSKLDYIRGWARALHRSSLREKAEAIGVEDE